MSVVARTPERTTLVRAVCVREWREAIGNKLLVGMTLLPPVVILGTGVLAVAAAAINPPSERDIQALYSAAPAVRGLDPVDAVQGFIATYFLILFMLIPTVVPLTMAIYSVIGEKSMRTLEPLLATPVGVGDLLFAKSLASTVPSVIVTWTAYAFYLTSVVLLGSRAAVNAVTAPRWVLAILVMVPLLTLLIGSTYLFLVRIPWRAWLAVAVLGAASLVALWTFVLAPYQKERILTYLDSNRDPLGKGYQVTQAKIAIGSGGIHGKGFRNGTQGKLGFIPARHTDFIFAVLGEEWGFIGVLIVLGLYLFLIVQALSFAKHARDRGGTFLVISLVSFFIFHVFINVSMQIGVLPTTGIPLPLLSYGGSSTMMFLIAIGLILNVDMRRFVNE